MSVARVLDEITAKDIPAVWEIEQASFSVPWRRDSFVSALERPTSIFLALRQLDELIGYSLSWVVADELHILKVAVRAGHRRQGLAKQLLAETMRRAVERRVATAWLEVRPSNVAARALYQALGFRETYVRRKYYTDNNEDAIILVRVFQPGDAF